MNAEQSLIRNVPWWANRASLRELRLLLYLLSNELHAREVSEAGRHAGLACNAIGDYMDRQRVKA